jgi:hypothetical protein
LARKTEVNRESRKAGTRGGSRKPGNQEGRELKVVLAGKENRRGVENPEDFVLLCRGRAPRYDD